MNRGQAQYESHRGILQRTHASSTPRPPAYTIALSTRTRRHRSVERPVVNHRVRIRNAVLHRSPSVRHVLAIERAPGRLAQHAHVMSRPHSVLNHSPTTRDRSPWQQRRQKVDDEDDVDSRSVILDPAHESYCRPPPSWPPTTEWTVLVIVSRQDLTRLKTKTN